MLDRRVLTTPPGPNPKGSGYTNKARLRGLYYKNGSQGTVNRCQRGTRPVLNPSREVLNPNREVLNPNREVLNPNREVLNSSREVLNPNREV